MAGRNVTVEQRRVGNSRSDCPPLGRMLVDKAAPFSSLLAGEIKEISKLLTENTPKNLKEILGATFAPAYLVTHQQSKHWQPRQKP